MTVGHIPCRLRIPTVHDSLAHGIQLSGTCPNYDATSLPGAAHGHTAEAVEGHAVHWRVSGAEHRPEQHIACGDQPVTQPGYQVGSSRPCYPHLYEEGKLEADRQSYRASVITYGLQ